MKGYFRVNGNTTTIENCYFYHTSTDNSFIGGPSPPLCQVYKDPTVVFPVDLTPEKIEQFLSKMCSAVGKTQMSFSVLAFAFAIFSFVCIFFGVLCCPKNFGVIMFAIVFASMSAASSIIAFVLWIYVASPLHSLKKTSYSISFVLCIISMVLSLFVIGFLICHMNKARQQRSSPRTDPLISSPRTPGTQPPGAATNLV